MNLFHLGDKNKKRLKSFKAVKAVGANDYSPLHHLRGERHGSQAAGVNNGPICRGE
jgi:hypothetical protein